MTKVISVKFGKRKYQGPARCLTCEHEWEAESDDYSWLDCPRCKSMRGMWVKLWTIPQGIQQVLEAIASGEVSDYQDHRYSNVKFLEQEGAQLERDDWAREMIRNVAGEGSPAA